VRQLGRGIFLLGDTCLAVASAAAAAAPTVWQHAGAVLHLGSHPLAGMEGEQAAAGQQEQEQQAVAAAQGGSCNGAATQGGRCNGAVAAAKDGSCKATLPASALAAAATRAPPTACRFCWLPVCGSKEDRQSLQRQLPAALAFCGTQLRQGRRVLLCCDGEGLDASTCTSVACLLAFYRLEERPGGGGGLAPVWAGGERSAGSCEGQQQQSGDAPPGQQQQQRFPPVCGAAGFSKLAVRQHLAAVTAHYPAARPTRGMLRQVFNFHLAELGAGFE
jgi:tRNA A64-2'-O-ribosylphosphate transferase